MLSDAEIDALKKRRICYRCVGEPYLRDEIRNNGKRGKCSYFAHTAKQYSIGALTERIKSVFEEHYVRTPDEPSPEQYLASKDEESDYEWERDGEAVVDAIMNLADIPEQAASDIQAILEDKFADRDPSSSDGEAEFASTSHYDTNQINDARWQSEWATFERRLKTEIRYYSPSATEHLKAVFANIHAMRDRNGKPAIVEAGPKRSLTRFFRARAFQSDEKLRTALKSPDKHIGPPPSEVATSGRMNARGISVFYGASTAKAALAEVRPPVGSQVAVARFDIVRPVRLLDLRVLTDVMTTGSFFDPDFGARLEHAKFLGSLSRRITTPVMPEQEEFDYLPTQFIADFLASGSVGPIDGIVFPSVQVAGKSFNVVLFRHAARVQEIQLPVDTKLDARLGQMYEEGWEREYVVTEEVPPPKAEPESSARKHPLDLNLADQRSADLDDREPTLSIKLDSIQIYVVKAVRFTTSAHSVRRYRWEKEKNQDF